MNFLKYTGYFHDGNLIDLRQEDGNVEFIIESAQIDPNEIDIKEMLSQSNTLKGTLRVMHVKTIKIGNKPYNGFLAKVYDDGEILDLEINANNVVLLIEWKNFPPKQRINVTTKIELEAEFIEWIPEIYC
ncbi:MAG: hypothetical protein V4494_05860 [Chlamydiota bacterium]